MQDAKSPESIDSPRPTPEQLRRYVELGGKCRELGAELQALNAERASLKDAIETDLEAYGRPIDGFQICIEYGKQVIDWQRAFRSLVSDEATARLIAASSRATVLNVVAISDGTGKHPPAAVV